MAETKKKSAKKAAEVVEETAPAVKKAEKKVIVKDVCEECKYTKGGGHCKTCVEFK